MVFCLNHEVSPLFGGGGFAYPPIRRVKRCPLNFEESKDEYREN